MALLFNIVLRFRFLLLRFFHRLSFLCLGCFFILSVILSPFPLLISFTWILQPPSIDLLIRQKAPHSSTLAWKIPWTEEPGGLQSMGSLRVGHDWVTSLSLFTFMHWRRKWQPTPVFLPGESQGWEPGGLPSMGSHRVGHDWRDLAAAAALKGPEEEASQSFFFSTASRRVLLPEFSGPRQGNAGHWPN